MTTHGAVVFPWVHSVVRQAGRRPVLSPSHRTGADGTAAGSGRPMRYALPDGSRPSKGAGDRGRGECLRSVLRKGENFFAIEIDDIWPTQHLSSLGWCISHRASGASTFSGLRTPDTHTELLFRLRCSRTRATHRRCSCPSRQTPQGWCLSRSVSHSLEYGRMPAHYPVEIRQYMLFVHRGIAMRTVNHRS